MPSSCRVDASTLQTDNNGSAPFPAPEDTATEPKGPQLDQIGRELQKWTQCAACEKWRKIPYTVDDDQLPDDWTCAQNVWDSKYSTCDMPQQLTNDEIDSILQLQAEQLEAAEQAAAAAAAVAVVHDQPYEYAASYDDPNAYDDEDYDEGNRRKKSGGRWSRGRGRGRGRSTAKGRNRRDSDSNVGRGMSTRGRGRFAHRGDQDEAAEALLGMGYSLDENGEAVAAPQRRSGERFLPGKIVWAKVEGHDWWPAKVVRRRAVPREVGLPIGGQDAVKFQIPVVFFGPNGVPGDATGIELSAGLSETAFKESKLSTRGFGGSSRKDGLEAHFKSKEADKAFQEAMDIDDEAEYAWLPAEALKSFKHGDKSANGEPAEDETLQASIAVANKAVEDNPDQQEPGADIESDSDGGWGPTTNPHTHYRSSRRGRGGRRGRGRGGRRGRGRGRWSARYEDDEASGEEDGDSSIYQGGAASDIVPGRIVVEAILAWRWPAGGLQPQMKKEQTHDKEQNSGADNAHAVENTDNTEIKLEGNCEQAKQNGDTAPMDTDTKEDDNKPLQEDNADNSQATVAADDNSKKDENGTSSPRIMETDSIPNDQQDAARAMVEKKEEIPNNNSPADDPEADAVAALLAAADSPGASMVQEPEYLVKYVGKSHVHNEWVPEETLLQIAKRKVLNFKKRHGCGPEDAPVDLSDPQWSVPERMVARRPAPYNPGWEILVKWKGLGYEHATWETEGESFLQQQDTLELTRALWERQLAAVRRSTPKALETAQTARIEARSSLKAIETVPESVAQGGTLHPHQMEALNWLQEQWTEGNNAILADEPGLGKTATTLAFFALLRTNYSCPGPVLVITPAAALQFWEGECTRWLGAGVDVVVYHGTQVARSVLLENELWLQPDSLDGRGVTRPLIRERIPKPDVVVASHEAFAADASDLRAIRWEVAVLDERNRARRGLSKAYAAASDISARYRLLLTGYGTINSIPDLMCRASFLHPQYQSLSDLPGNVEDKDESVQLSSLKSLCDPFTLRRPRTIAGPLVNPPAEVRIVVDLSPEQKAAYRDALTRSYELLSDPKASRFSGYRAAQLKNLAVELRRICCHPSLSDHFAENNKNAGSASTTPIPAAAAAAIGMTSSPSSPDVSVIDVSSESLDSVLKDSPKLVAIDAMLRAMKERSERVAVLAHCSETLDLIQRCITARFGAEASVRVDVKTPSLERKRAYESFNAAESPASFFLLHPKACGLGTDLPTVGIAVFVDSEWSAATDLASLSHAHSIGEPGTLRVYRFFCRGTLEERLLALGEKTRGLEGALKQSHGRAYSPGARLFEDVLRWGVESLFEGARAGNLEEEKQRIHGNGGAKSVEERNGSMDAAMEPKEDAGTNMAVNPEHPEIKPSDDQSSPYLTDDTIRNILEKDPKAALAACEAAAVNDGDAGTVCYLSSDLEDATVVDLRHISAETTDGEEGKAQSTVWSFTVLLLVDFVRCTVRKRFFQFDSSRLCRLLGGWDSLLLYLFRPGMMISCVPEHRIIPLRNRVSR